MAKYGLDVGKSKHLETESMKKQKEQTQRKRRRYLEILSLTCSTVGLNMIIACFCGLTKYFGFKSPGTIFECAFGFLLASVLLGIVAMISSATGYECWKTTSLATLNYLLPCRLLRRLYSSKNKYIQEPVIIYKLENKQSSSAEASATSENNITPKYLDDQPRVKPKDSGICRKAFGQSSLFMQSKDGSSESKKHLGVCRNTREKCTKDLRSAASSITTKPDKNEIVCFPTSKTNGSNQVASNFCDDFLPSKALKDHGLSTKTSGQSYALSPSKCIAQSDGKVILQLTKRPNAFLFDQSLAAGSSPGFTKASRQISCSVERDDGRSRLTLTVQDCFVAEVNTNKEPFQIQLNPGEIVSRCLSGVTNPYEIRNAYSEAGRGCNFQEGFFPSTNQRFPNDHVSDVISKINKMNFLS